MNSRSRKSVGSLRAKLSDADMRVNLWDGATVSAWIDKSYGIKLGVQAMSTLIPAAGLSASQIQSGAGARRSGTAKEALKKLRRLMEDESVDLWAPDEAHFQQPGSRCRM